MATLTSRGQVTIPKAIRAALNLQPGTKVEFSIDAIGDVVMKPARAARRRGTDRFDAVRGAAQVRWRTDELMTLLRRDP